MNLLNLRNKEVASKMDYMVKAGDFTGHQIYWIEGQWVFDLTTWECYRAFRGKDGGHYYRTGFRLVDTGNNIFRVEVNPGMEIPDSVCRKAVDCVLDYGEKKEEIIKGKLNEDEINKKFRDLDLRIINFGLPN